MLGAACYKYFARGSLPGCIMRMQLRHKLSRRAALSNNTMSDLLLDRWPLTMSAPPDSSNSRPSLPSSSRAFALPALLPPNGGLTVDIGVSPLMMLRSRAPSTLGRLTSPLASALSAGEESDRERMSLDGETPPSGGSQGHTPPLVQPALGPPADVDPARVRARRRRTEARSRSPSTPPRGDSGDFTPRHLRRPSYPSHPVSAYRRSYYMHDPYLSRLSIPDFSK
jgi:hypothetical protein